MIAALNLLVFCLCMFSSLYSAKVYKNWVRIEEDYRALNKVMVLYDLDDDWTDDRYETEIRNAVKIKNRMFRNIWLMGILAGLNLGMVVFL